MSAFADRSIYTPSEWGNRVHNTKADEIFCAGSAGPGKTTLLIADVLPQVIVEHQRCADKKHPYHIQWGDSVGWALHLRRKMGMLKQTIDKAKKLYKRIDPGFHWSDDTGTFSSGYKITFGHCWEDDSHEQYMSSDYCVAAGTMVRMANGTYKRIELIEPGEYVDTLEGPRAVTHHWDSGVKACSSWTTRFRGEIVGSQTHPTTHPVLLWPTAESRFSRFQDSRQTWSRERPHGLFWQDYESLLCGLPESPVKRASVLDSETCSEAFDGLRQEVSRLEALYVPVALHEQTVRQSLERRRSSIGCCEDQAFLGPSGSSLQGSLPPQQAIPRGLRREAADAQQGPGRDETILSYGVEDARFERGIATGSVGGCSSYRDPRGGQPRHAPGIFLGLLRQQDDVGRHSRSDRSPGFQAETPSRNPSGELAYPHFYSGGCRPRIADIRMGEAEVRFCGFFQTYDLTVDGANHYITESGIVNAQTHIAFDELVQFNQEQYDQVTGRCRTTDPVLINMLRKISASNPHQKREGTRVKNQLWVRDYFVEPAPQGNVMLERDITLGSGEVTKRTRIFIPARLSDNPDAEFRRIYEAELRSKPLHMQRALLDGDWYSSPNSFFGCEWRKDYHQCKAFKVPLDWKHFRAMDWGYRTHGWVGWFAIDPEGTLYLHREFYFRMLKEEQVAQLILEIETDMGLAKGGKSLLTGPADSQLWEQRGDTGISKAARMARKGVKWVKAKKGPGSRRANAERVMKRIRDHEEFQKAPGLIIFDSCVNALKHLLAIMPDEDDSEIPDETYVEDHAIDGVFYGTEYADRIAIGKKSPKQSEEDGDEDDDASEGDSEERGQYGYGV